MWKGLSQTPLTNEYCEPGVWQTIKREVNLKAVSGELIFEQDSRTLSPQMPRTATPTMLSLRFSWTAFGISYVYRSVLLAEIREEPDIGTLPMYELVLRNINQSIGELGSIGLISSIAPCKHRQSKSRPQILCRAKELFHPNDD